MRYADVLCEVSVRVRKATRLRRLLRCMSPDLALLSRPGRPVIASGYCVTFGGQRVFEAALIGRSALGGLPRPGSPALRALVASQTSAECMRTLYGVVEGLSPR